MSKMKLPKDPQERVKILLDKLQEQNIPAELREQLLGWLVSEEHAGEKEKWLAELFTETFDYSTMPSERALELYSEFRYKQATLPRKNTKKLRYRRPLFQVAAALTLLLTISGTILLWPGRTEEINHPTRMSVVTVATTELSGDQREDSDDTVAIVTENSVHTLPDNSTVKIGAGSKIKHIEQFAGKRHVELQGEARFHVTKATDEKDYFTVHTGHFDIKVLGTQFNIRCPAGDTHSSIDLYHGSVEVNAGGQVFKMKPTEHLHYDHISQQATLTNIPYGQLSYDTMPGLLFSGNPMTDALEVLRKDYGISFVIRGNMPRQVKTIKADLTDLHTLDEVMSVLQKVSGRFTYEIGDHEVIITCKV